MEILFGVTTIMLAVTIIYLLQENERLRNLVNDWSIKYWNLFKETNPLITGSKDEQEN